MRQFELEIEPRADIPAVLSQALCNMESLKASREDWASLLNAMGVNLHYHYHQNASRRTLDEAAKHIVVTAVPEEGDPHPQRARAQTEGGNGAEAEFITPGGVLVHIRRTKSGLHLGVYFKRDSTHLATLVLADIFRRVPEAAPLLAEAAAEAAAKIAVPT